MPQSVDLKTLDRTELECLAAEMREPTYRGRQIFEWIFGKGARSFSEMTNLPLRFREELERTHRIGRAVPVSTASSGDGTIKSLIQLESGRHVEAVLIPDASGSDVRRLTACVSSQVGCAMACAFCATGTMGFQQNLTSGEIFDQARLMNTLATERYGRGLTNIVFMGMGEPLANYARVREAIRRMVDVMGMSARSITVSTVGIVPGIKRLAEEPWPVYLAVSLHAADDELRSTLVPINKRYPIADLEDAAASYFAKKGRRVSIEWTMMDGVNDSEDQALKLAAIARRLRAHVNLIALNPTPLSDQRASTRLHIREFSKVLEKEGINVTIRDTRGQDIDAACGQLRVLAGNRFDPG